MTRLQQITFPLRSEFITLDSLIKACGLANSGGQAKAMVADGLVQVDGQQELRKTAKIRAGQVVSMPGARIRVEAVEADGPGEADASDAG
ncbi:RNA-binding S4 domain-containing protein [Aquabacterium parvum]|uniref:RNA-binding S4 domain-containing protein n=1 Tax=Aquabacterium parvum TaxID=70584 RepID=UPI000718E634|nr:RNA-binding S4 domain-containing protein [Aquabacterium parvum]MBU0917532.1 RNA-binding S4 domain-containing protein [Gammaproteobacteria bacterium]